MWLLLLNCPKKTLILYDKGRQGLEPCRPSPLPEEFAQSLRVSVYLPGCMEKKNWSKSNKLEMRILQIDYRELRQMIIRDVGRRKFRYIEAGGLKGFACKKGYVEQLIPPQIWEEVIEELWDEGKITLENYDTLMACYRSGDYNRIVNNRIIKSHIVID